MPLLKFSEQNASISFIQRFLFDPQKKKKRVPPIPFHHAWALKLLHDKKHHLLSRTLIELWTFFRIKLLNHLKLNLVL
jgi:hypothetical protein